MSAGARLAAAALTPLLLLAAGCGGDDRRAEAPKAPTSVEIAHIMLEKRQAGKELDRDSAREVVRKRKTHDMMIELEREELEAAMKSADFRCEAPITLFKKRRKENEEAR